MGNISAYLFYFINVIAFSYTTAGDDDADDHTAFLSHARNPLGISGLDCLQKDPALFWFTFLMMMATLLLWARLVFLAPNPGLVDTRQADFDEVLFAMQCSDTCSSQSTWTCCDMNFLCRSWRRAPKRGAHSLTTRCTVEPPW